MPRMPQVTARELVRFPKSQGFVEDRQSGGRGLAIRILKDAGFTIDDYLPHR
jgi:hypothetical protein